MQPVERKRRSFLPKTTQTSEPPIKYCRITEENCRSAKIIENECRLSDSTGFYPESSASAPNVSFYNDPSNFLSCGCLGSPKQVWHSLCESREKDNGRRSKNWKKLEVKGVRSRVTTLLAMIQLCEHMKYRRETYHRAIDIFDRIMAVFDFEAMNKSEIIFTGIFAVFIASKVEERKKNHWRNIADYIRQVSPCERMESESMLDLEMKIVTNINWSFRAITALEWAKIYAHMMRVYTIYKRIRNLTLTYQSTPTKKRTKVTCGAADDEEVDLFTWAQLDDLVIGEPSMPVHLCNRIAIAQVLDLCMIDLCNFNFTYRQLGAAACVSVLGFDYEIALRITGLKMKDLRPAIDFVNSHRRIYMKYVHEEGANIAPPREDELLQCFKGLDEDEEIEEPKYRKIIEMECGCGCEKRSILNDMNELEKMISSFTYHKRKGKTMGKIFITKRNQQGEIKVRREIPIPHPTEALEKQMARYYTQSFPLETQKTKRVIKYLQRFWMEYENHQLCRGRHSHSVPRQSGRTSANQRRKSG